MSNPKIYYTSQGYLRTVSMRHWTLPVVLKQDHDAAVEQLKAENEELKTALELSKPVFSRRELESRIEQLKSKLEIAKKALKISSNYLTASTDTNVYAKVDVLVLVSPAEKLRIQAREIEKKDADVATVRQALKEIEG